MEETFKHGKYEIVYIFSKKASSNKLIVVFSGCAKIYAEDRHPYNFQNVLSAFPANILYIRDNIGNRGCYYLASKGDFEVSDAVCELIKKISSECNINTKDIITLGSSKGGSAALHIGLKLKCGNIISAVPQTLIATYCKTDAIDTYKDIMPDEDDIDAFKRIDEYIYNQLKQNYDSTIHLLTSEGDEQYLQHIYPLLSHLQKNKANRITIDNRIKCHNDCKNYLVDYVISTLFSIVFNCEIIQTEDTISIKRKKSRFEFSAIIGEANSQIKTISYIDNIILDLDYLTFLELHVKRGNDFSFSWNVYNWLKHLSGAEIELKNGNAVLTIVNNKKLLQPVQYALYQSPGSSSQIAFQYQSSNTFILDLNTNSTPTDFQLFVRDTKNRASNRIVIENISFKNELQKFLYLLKYSFTINNSTLNFTLNLSDCTKDYQYCFYVVKNNSILHKGNYSSSPEISLELSESGKYRIIYFINDCGHKEYMYSKSIEFQKKNQ